MKLKLSLNDTLCYSESIYVDFKLNKPRLTQLWPPLDGIHEQNWKYFYTCQEETSVAVLQDHVTGEVFNTEPRNIA